MMIYAPFPTNIICMTERQVVKMGNRQLASPSTLVTDFSDAELSGILTDMYDTMQAESGVGIAAPQIGHNIRVIMFYVESNPRYPGKESVPFTILINPSIEILSDEMVDDWEGCLSVPGLRGLVPRYNHIRYQGYDQSGQLITRVAEGFHARVVQHECDHLDGILYPQRIKDLKYFGFEDELAY
jgi:peptide deformylase